jgi:hypothetical protein
MSTSILPTVKPVVKRIRQATQRFFGRKAATSPARQPRRGGNPEQRSADASQAPNILMKELLRQQSWQVRCHLSRIDTEPVAGSYLGILLNIDPIASLSPPLALPLILSLILYLIIFKLDERERERESERERETERERQPGQSSGLTPSMEPAMVLPSPSSTKPSTCL